VLVKKLLFHLDCSFYNAKWMQLQEQVMQHFDSFTLAFFITLYTLALDLSIFSARRAAGLQDY